MSESDEKIAGTADREEMAVPESERSDGLDLYLIGVGGQGINMLSEAMIRAADYAGYRVRGVDTHGLAQRGGMVVSNLRLGEGAHSPLIQKGQADMVIALERNEALRGISTHLKPGGELIYYDVSWQTLSTRLDKEEDIGPDKLAEEAEKFEAGITRVYKDDLEDSRMQNVVLIGHLAGEEKIPGLKPEHYRQALRDLMSGSMLEKNLELFDSLL